MAKEVRDGGETGTDGGQKRLHGVEDECRGDGIYSNVLEKPCIRVTKNSGGGLGLMNVHKSDLWSVPGAP